MKEKQTMPFSTHFLSRAAAASLLGLALAGIPAVAQAAPAAAPAATGNLRIAVIDTEKILLSSNAGKKAVADLKKLQEQREKELGARAQELKDLQSKINDGRLSLAQDKLADLSKQYEEKEISLRRAQDDATRELTKKRDEMLASIDDRVMPVINQVGKELGYTLIFRKFESGLIYADDGVDITNVVIQRIDAGAQGK
jgi:outer membrane protein